MWSAAELASTSGVRRVGVIVDGATLHGLAKEEDDAIHLVHGPRDRLRNGEKRLPVRVGRAGER